MKFAIEKNIPVPVKGSGLTFDLTETMKDLQLNDSFLVLFNKARPEKAVTSAYQYARKKFKDRLFTSKKAKSDPGGSPGLRIWRVPIPPSPKSA